ncbi:MAG: hypothetical protein ABSD32_10390 [Mycobacterium sp.]|jgi:hypothetical protein
MTAPTAEKPVEVKKGLADSQHSGREHRALAGKRAFRSAVS